MIDELANEGPPMYYSLASGQSFVVVRQIYVTNLDRVKCLAPYSKVENTRTNAIYESCDVPCHESCFGGCNKENDPSSCMDCVGDKLYYSASKFICIPNCNQCEDTGSCLGTEITEVAVSETRQQRVINYAFDDDYYQYTNSTGHAIANHAMLIYMDEDFLAPAPLGEKLCRACHPECAYGCFGTSDRHCVSNKAGFEILGSHRLH